MCTRFYIEPETEELKALLEEVRRSPLYRKFIHAGSAVLTSGEIRPTDVVPVVAPGKTGARGTFPMRWGFRIPGRPPVVNARTETAPERSMFREAWAKHRCVIPASWYYEWEHPAPSAQTPAQGGPRPSSAVRYMIQPRGASMTWLAGLYRIEEGFPVFAVLTREPSEALRRIHDRMPLILPEEYVGEWIRPDGDPAALLAYALTDMVAERG